MQQNNVTNFKMAYKKKKPKKKQKKKKKPQHMSSLHKFPLISYPKSDKQ